jgi:hypothetical protein
MRGTNVSHLATAGEAAIAHRRHPARAAVRFGRLLVAVCLCVMLGACATTPLMPYSADTPPLILVPASHAGIQDQRARFRDIFCAVLEARARDIPDYQPCDEALTRVGAEPAGTGRPVALGPSSRRLVAAVVPGFGHECIAPWLEAPGTVAAHVRKYAYDQIMIQVDPLSSSLHNARQLRDAVLAMPQEPGAPRLVLIGYSKGAPDILEALVAFPELRSRVAAVVTAAGAVGGSPLANDAEQYQANLLRHFPKATCGAGDGGAVESLRSGTRKAWLATHALPPEVPFYRWSRTRSRIASRGSSSQAITSSAASTHGTTARSYSTIRWCRAAPCSAT